MGVCEVASGVIPRRRATLVTFCESDPRDGNSKAGSALAKTTTIGEHGAPLGQIQLHTKREVLCGSRLSHARAYTVECRMSRRAGPPCARPDLGPDAASNARRRPGPAMRPELSPQRCGCRHILAPARPPPEAHARQRLGGASPIRCLAKQMVCNEAEFGRLPRGSSRRARRRTGPVFAWVDLAPRVRHSGGARAPAGIQPGHRRHRLHCLCWGRFARRLQAPMGRRGRRPSRRPSWKRVTGTSSLSDSCAVSHTGGQETGPQHVGLLPTRRGERDCVRSLPRARQSQPRNDRIDCFLARAASRAPSTS